MIIVHKVICANRLYRDDRIYMYLDYKMKTYADLSSASLAETRDSDTEQCLIIQTLVITLLSTYHTFTLVAFVVGYIYIKQQCRRY